MNNLILETVVIEDEAFYKEVCYGLSKNEINNELKVINKDILLSPRLLLRCMDIHDKFIDKWYRSILKTKSKRIRKKYYKKIETRSIIYIDGFDNFN